MEIVTGTSYAEGQMCGLLAVDIAGFGAPDRDDDIQQHLRAALYGMLECAFNRSDVPWEECVHEDRGDGALITIPPVIPVPRVLNPLPEVLNGLLRRHNRLSAPSACMQLRAAAHVGYVCRDQYGYTGTAIVQLCRLLDAPALRRLLADSGAEMTFAVSDYVFDSIISQNATLTDPDSFSQLPVEVKETRSVAWAYLPGTRNPADTALPASDAHPLAIPISRRCGRGGGLAAS
jgi:hypothetical protein